MPIKKNIKRKVKVLTPDEAAKYKNETGNDIPKVSSKINYIYFFI